MRPSASCRSGAVRCLLRPRAERSSPAGLAREAERGAVNRRRRPRRRLFRGPWATWAPGRRKIPGWRRLPEHAFEVLDLPLKLTNTPRIPLGAEAGAFLPFLVEHLLQFRALRIPLHIRLPGARSTARPHAERTRAGCQAVLRHGRPGVGYAAPEDLYAPPACAWQPGYRTGFGGRVVDVSLAPRNYLGIRVVGWLPHEVRPLRGASITVYGSAERMPAPEVIAPTAVNAAYEK
jgi:hypothetical protein